jgi:IMP dehydrogenase
MAIICEVDGKPMIGARGLSIYEVRFVPGTGWEALDPAISNLQSKGIAVNDSLKPENYDLSVVLKPGVVLNRPYLASNMSTVTNVEMVEIMNNQGAAGVLHQFAPLPEREKWVATLYDRKVDKARYPLANTIDNEGTPLIFAAVGYEELEEASLALVKKGARVVVFDTENAYTPSFRKKVERATGEIKSKDGGDKVVFIAGNIATGWGAENLFPYVDLVKVNIGSGTPCETPKHGVHVAPLGVIYETSQVAKDMGKGIIYDGGAKDSFSHSVALAFAQLVMAGSYWAATEESAGEKMLGKDLGIVDDSEGWYTLYQGSASTEARRDRENEYPEKYGNKKRSYRPSEGRSGWLKVQGPVEKVIERTDRTVRLNMHYVGAYDPERGKFTLDAFRRYAVLQRMSEESLRQLNKAANFAAPRSGK